METASNLIRHQLNSLLDQAEYISKLQNYFYNAIDTQLKPHIKVAAYSDQCLTVIASNASIATRLRFIESDLISKLQNTPELKSLKKIKCKVRPNETVAKKITIERKISSENLKLIKKTAEHIKDEKIRRALENISNVK